MELELVFFYRDFVCRLLKLPHRKYSKAWLELYNKRKYAAAIMEAQTKRTNQLRFTPQKERFGCRPMPVWRVSVRLLTSFASLFIIQLNMQNYTEILPFYVVFHPLPTPSSMLPMQGVFPQPSNVFWGVPLASTNCYLQSEWPQNNENISLSGQLLHHNLPLVAGGASEGEVRNGRRAKCKRVRNSSKELESAKKNSESNIVNQLYSFFNSYQKSEGVVQRAIVLLNKKEGDLDKIKYVFYNIIRLINYRRGRKYVNKDNILTYYRPHTFLNSIPDINDKLAEINLLTLQELCLLIRITTNYFLKNISPTAILTSKRISLLAKGEHLKRRRRVLHSLHLQNQ